jgi:hypothetical protein
LLRWLPMSFANDINDVQTTKKRRTRRKPEKINPPFALFVSSWFV